MAVHQGSPVAESKLLRCVCVGGGGGSNGRALRFSCR